MSIKTVDVSIILATGKLPEGAPFPWFHHATETSTHIQPAASYIHSIPGLSPSPEQPLSPFFRTPEVVNTRN